jgi:hypothetical protein
MAAPAAGGFVGAMGLLCPETLPESERDSVAATAP